jgi:hypothetical protein
MSTNNECLFFKWKSGMWYYLLEDCHAPKNAWDWRDHATCYGPFTDLEMAEGSLHLNHANPGGSTIDPEPDWDDESLQKHVSEAIDESRRYRFRG